MTARRQLIAALSEDTCGGIATLHDVTDAEQLVNAHDAEVTAETLRHAADSIRHIHEQCTLGYLACRGCLVRRNILDVLRSVAHVIGEKATAASAPATPDFFVPGRTYTEPDGSTDWRFRCDAITTHPEDGERTALGWRHFRGEWSECAYGEDDFEIHQIADHINTTEGGPDA